MATAAATATTPAATCGHGLYHWNAFDRLHAEVHGASAPVGTSDDALGASPAGAAASGAPAPHMSSSSSSLGIPNARALGAGGPLSSSDGRPSGSSSMASSVGAMGTCRRPLRRVPARYQPRKPPRWNVATKG